MIFAALNVYEVMSPPVMPYEAPSWSKSQSVPGCTMRWGQNDEERH